MEFHPHFLPKRLLVLTALASALAGCSWMPKWMQQEEEAPVVTRYNAEGTPPPERMAQFYDPRSRKMVYRFCVGAECPEPTPKKPATITHPVVMEVGIDGFQTPVKPEPPIALNKPTLPTPALPSARAKTTQINLDSEKKAAPPKTGEPVVTAKPGTTPANPPCTSKTCGPVAPSAPFKLEHPVREKTETPAPAATASTEQAPAQPAPTAQPSPQNPAAAAPAPASPRKVPRLPENLQGILPVPAQPTRVPSAPSAQADPALKPAQLLATWTNLWSKKQADAYFELYAADFKANYGPSDANWWKNRRRMAMAKPGTITVSTQPVQIVENDDKASVRFWQTFESSTFRSRVLKKLDLVKVDGQWKIHREQLLSQTDATA